MAKALRLIGEVNFEKVDGLVKDIIDLEEAGIGAKLELYLASHGGGVGAGISFYEFIKYRGVPLKTIGVGVVDSVAFPLWFAGQTEQRKITKRTTLLVHRILHHYDKESFNPDQILSNAMEAQKLEDHLFQIVADETGKKLSDIISLATQNVRLDVREALNLGLIKEWEIA
ncbi:hypothetical protein A3H65_00295 [Candidatus Giovannonibacteria bacterium RIFCSPLOWO2_02_FULL_45_14]|uniref:Clp protease, ATP-dependent Clp protease, protease subunit n=2 Tax=Parcubacteria group TaxID=1794811 RepID=A0A0H4TPA6_9BACT|nr:Clp protease, ATP-dependent Clp protease, protease subunit [uncultured Parcubacteria bacterium Rifle_16ft_4_minimus_37658]OGF69279.1 MAG: hypothetical protein A3C75_03775 [Candidatus Giovannonibacteria bacterium RIFCSPHIGHO2_02_FULL_44_31]OGF76260.1 MAG: hypothetical protein A3E62_03970 [Candidatus Giovannonibacteria bacterium RIFCSPHIGHO2_12_FULL_44_29]OGF91154.1 MAG: hypothetical protein A3H65_00295 [Candidatus Giovannonibacteria bacterium RIFCSPLOWO2_02_FULL_45_14]OGF93613.1 MAG: hypothet